MLSGARYCSPNNQHMTGVPGAPIRVGSGPIVIPDTYPKEKVAGVFKTVPVQPIGGADKRHSLGASPS